MILDQKKINYSFSPMATVQNKLLSIFQLHLFPFCDIGQQEFEQQTSHMHHFKAEIHLKW